MPDELTHIILRYRGSDVDSGTMPVTDVLDALQGFAGAYGKVASRFTPEVTHQLRVSAVNKSSFEMALVVGVGIALPYAQQINRIHEITDAARFVLNIVLGTIRAKKHLKGEPYRISVKGNSNTLIVLNVEGSELALPPEALELYKEKFLDSSLSKITAPLHDEAVSSAEIVAEEGSKSEQMALISSSEKDYFRPSISTTTSKETQITGRLISLNKETNRGTFKMSTGKNVSYSYKGSDKEHFHSDFAYRGPIRVTCVADFDENLDVLNIDILEIHKLQKEFAFPPES